MTPRRQRQSSLRDGLDVQSHGYNHVYIQDYTDEDIIRDMKILSKGQLELAPDFKLNEIKETAPIHKPKKKFQQRKNK